MLDLDMEKWLKSREAKDILERLMARPPKVDSKSEPEEPVAAFFKAKLDQARIRVTHLYEIISVRDYLLSESLCQIDYQISKAATSLDEFSLFGVGCNTGVDMKRNHIERQLASFRRERREIRIKAWQDLAGLRKELREAIVEYQEIMRRYRFAGYKM